MRYGGFGRRVMASLLDGLILLPVGILFIYLQGTSKSTAVMVAVPAALLYAFYIISMHGFFGATFGKLCLGLRVVAEYSERKVSFSSAFRRGSIYFCYGLIIAYAQVIGIQAIPEADYLQLEWFMREAIIQESTPAWVDYAQYFVLGWAALSMLMMLVSSKKRTLHDYLAGSIVINTKHRY